MQNAQSPQSIIKLILKQIKQSQKKIRVQISVHLKQIEEYIFQQKPQLKQADIQLLFMGIQEEKLPGILNVCGVKSSLKGNLKKASYTAMSLLLKLLTEAPQKKEIQAVFFDLEDEDYQQLKLSIHMISDSEKKISAFHVARLIREKRPHLDIDMYVEGKKPQEQFLNWFQKYKDEQAQQEINQTKWKEDDGGGLQNIMPSDDDSDMQNSTIKHREEKLKQQKKLIEEIRQRKITAPQSNQEGNDNVQMRNQKKSIIKKQKEGQQMMRKSNIKKKTVMKMFEDDNPENRESYNQNQQSSQMDQITLNKSLIYLYFDDYFKIEKSINKIQIEFISNENKGKEGKTFILMNKLLNLSQDLNKNSEILNIKKADSDSYRIMLIFLQKTEHLQRLPQDMKKCYNRNEFSNIVRLYQENRPFIQKYKHFSIYQTLYQELQKIIQLASSSLKGLIKINLKNYNKTNELISLLLDLQLENPLLSVFKDIQQTLITLIKTNIFQLDIDAIDDKETDDQQTEGEEKQQQKLSDNKQQLNQTMIQQLQQLNFEGDMLNQFLEETGLAFKSESQLDCLALENFFNELIPQLENYYCLCAAYLKGDFDYKLYQKEDKSKRIKPITRLLVSVFKLIFNGLTNFLKKIEDIFLCPSDPQGTRSVETFKKQKLHLQAMSRTFKALEDLILKKIKEIKVIEKEEFKAIKDQLFHIFWKHLLIEAQQVQFNEFKLVKVTKKFFGQTCSSFLDQLIEIIQKSFQQINELPSFTNVDFQNLPFLTELLKKLIEQGIESFLMVGQKLNQQAAAKQESNQQQQNQMQQQAQQQQYISQSTIFLLTILADIAALEKENMLLDLINQIFHDFKKDPQIKKKIFIELMTSKPKKYLAEKSEQLKQNYVSIKSQEIISCLINQIFNQVQPQASQQSQQQQQTSSSSLQMIDDQLNFEANLLYNYNIIADQQEKFEIRYQILDILTDMVILQNELLQYCPCYSTDLIKLILQDIASQLLQNFQKIIGNKDLVSIKQIWLEIEFIQNVMDNFQTEKSQKDFEIFFKEILKACNNKEIFSENELFSKKKLIRNTKYKCQYNFKSLMQY